MVSLEIHLCCHNRGQRQFKGNLSLKKTLAVPPSRNASCVVTIVGPLISILRNLRAWNKYENEEFSLN